MYFFELVCIFLLIFFSEVHTTEQCNKDCTKQCPTGMIPDFCTKQASSNNRQCVKDNREGMKHGHWDVDYNKGYRCILRCNDGYIANGCSVQRKWIEGMPTCVKDNWSRKMKDWGTTALKTAAVAGAAVGAGTCMVVATPVVVAAAGFGSGGVVAGSIAAGIQSTATAAGSLFAWAQSVGAVGYVGATGSAVIGGGTGTAAGGTTAYVISKLTGCEAE